MLFGRISLIMLPIDMVIFFPLDLRSGENLSLFVFGRMIIHKKQREQTHGTIDAFTCATGTGGTFAGVSLFLKQKRSSIRCVLAGKFEFLLFCFHF